MLDEKQTGPSTTLVKIRLSILALLAMAVFYYLGWNRFRFEYPTFPLTLALGDTVWSASSFATLYGVAVCFVGFFITGRHGRHIAFLATPFGLALWALLQGKAEILFVQLRGNKELAGIYPSLMVDTLLWTLPVVGALVVIGLLSRIMVRGNSAETQGTHSTQTSRGRFRFATNHLLSTGLTVVLSVIFLIIFARTRSEHFSLLDHSTIKLSTIITTGQAAFAVIIAFYLAVMISHQIIKAPLLYYLSTPTITALIAYGYGLYASGRIPIDAPDMYVGSSMVFTTILPLFYLGFGVPAAAWGYWQSMHIDENKIHLKENLG